MKKNIIIILIILVSFAVGIYFFPQMPEKMASHWNIRSEVDGYIPKFWGLFLMPIISLGLFLLFLLIPKIDPLKENIKKFKKYFDWFVFLIIVFLFYLYFLTIIWNIGFRFDFVVFLMPAFSLLFYYIGILTENAKRNWFIGIRTPWTLSNDKVWEKTHEIGGKLFKIVGLIALSGIIFPNYAFLLLIIPAIFSAIYVVVYSYFEYQKEKMS